MKFKVGLVGFGYIGYHHYNALLKLNSNFTLTSIFEKNLSIKKRNELPKKINIFSSFTKKNIPKDLDILIITAPTNLHIKFGKMAIEKVKTVIIEKPLGIEFKEAKKLIDYAQKLKKRVVVVKQMRLNPYFIQLKKIIKKKILGKIHFISIDIFLNRSKKYFSSSNWKGIKKYDGGTLFNQMCHFIDILYWIFGNLKYSSGNKISLDKKKNEHSGNLSLLFEDKIFTSINYSIKSYKNNLNTKMTIISKNATIELYPNDLVIKNSTPRVKKYIEDRKLNLLNEMSYYGKGFEKFYSEIHKLLSKKKYNTKNISFNKDAISSFKNLIKINNSMKIIYND